MNDDNHKLIPLLIINLAENTSTRVVSRISGGNGYLRNNQGIFINLGTLSDKAHRVPLSDSVYLFPHAIITAPSEDDDIEIMLGMVRSDDNQYVFVEGWKVIPESVGELHWAGAQTLQNYYLHYHHVSLSESRILLVPSL